MHRITSPGAASGGRFQDGNPGTGTPSTVLWSLWLNSLQDEVVNVVEDGGGLTLSLGAQNQLLTAIQSMIATAKAEAISSARVPAGQVSFFADDNVPSGWLACDGQTVSRTTYAGLFAAIGTRYNTGGEAGTVFRLPDARGQFFRAWDRGAEINPSRVLGSLEADMLAAHTHTIKEGSNNPVSGGQLTSGDDYTTITAATQISGSTGGAETRPVNIAFFACIKT